MLVAPGDSRSFHGFTIGEESLSRFAADDPSEGRSSSTLTVTLNRLFLTSRPWQVAQSSSKIPLPILGSPAGTTTSGSLIPFLALGGISNKIIVGESKFCLIKFHQIPNQSKSNPPINHPKNREIAEHTVYFTSLPFGISQPVKSFMKENKTNINKIPNTF